MNVFTSAYPAQCVVVTSNTPRLFEVPSFMLSCFVFRKQLNQHKLQAHCFAFVVSLLSLASERYKEATSQQKMSPQINSQAPLSDLPRLHVADESNMMAEMAELESCHYPGNARSKVREYTGGYWIRIRL